jgi:hypothetical protein
MRVHGVSGTPPREMLYTDPVTYDQTGSHTKVYRPTRMGGFEVSAFHWGSLTAGSWVTAFWVLLAPFAFANVAGWMMTTRGPWSRTWVRWAGLVLTCLLVAQGAVVLIDIPYHWILTKEVDIPFEWIPTTNDMLPQRSIVLGVIALTLGFVFLVWRLSTRSHFVTLNGRTQFNLVFSPKTMHLLPPRYWKGNHEQPSPHPQPLTEEQQWDDPGDQPISDPGLWQEHALLHRLRRIHLGSGFAVIALTLAVGSQSWWLGLIAGVPILMGFALVAMTAIRPRSVWVKRITAQFPIIGLSFLVVTGVLSLSEVLGELPADPHWTGIHELTFGVALLLGFAALGTWLSQVFGAWPNRRLHAVRTGWVAMGALTIATLLGSSLGMAAVLVAESWLGVDEITSNGVGWVAVAMLLLLISVLGATGVVILKGHYLPQDHAPCRDYPLKEAPTNGTRFALVRRITRRASWIFTTASVYGMAAGITAVIDARVPGTMTLSPTELSASAPYLTIAAAILWGVATLTLSFALFEYNGAVASGVLISGSALLVAVGFDFLPVITILGITLDLSTLEGLGKLLLVLGPAGMVAKGILTRSTGGSDKRRRGVGLLWDVGSLWPRWFHPLGPPSYGPDAVCHLLDQIRIKEERDRLHVLSAHSQGSLISAIAITQADPSEVANMGFLTYGSPIGLLYKPLFPAVGMAELVSQVDKMLSQRPWINLWRNTDYLGGCPVGLARGDREISAGVGHSLYELTDEFCRARNEAAGAPIQTPCW